MYVCVYVNVNVNVNANVNANANANVNVQNCKNYDFATMVFYKMTKMMILRSGGRTLNPELKK